MCGTRDQGQHCCLPAGFVWTGPCPAAAASEALTCPCPDLCLTILRTKTDSRCAARGCRNPNHVCPEMEVQPQHRASKKLDTPLICAERPLGISTGATTGQYAHSGSFGSKRNNCGEVRKGGFWGSQRWAAVGASGSSLVSRWGYKRWPQGQVRAQSSLATNRGPNNYRASYWQQGWEF